MFGDAPWSSPEAALAFVDPRFPQAFSVDTIADLLSVAAGEVVETTRSLDEEQFRLLMNHRVVPLIPESWKIPTNYRDEKRKLALWSMELEAASAEAIGILQAAGIEPIVLKGMATSYLDYARPELRHSGDLDILLKNEELAPACKRLQGQGFRRVNPPNVEPELGKGTALVGAGGIEVDLHTRLLVNSRNCSAKMIEAAVQVPPLGILALPVEVRLVHAACHLFYGPPEHRRLSSLADVSAILSTRSEDLPSKARSAARELDLEAATAGGLAAETALFGRDSFDLNAWTQPQGLLYLAHARSTRLRLAEPFYVASTFDGLRAPAKYIGRKVMPRREFLRERGGLIDHLRGPRR